MIWCSDLYKPNNWQHISAVRLMNPKTEDKRTTVVSSSTISLYHETACWRWLGGWLFVRVLFHIVDNVTRSQLAIDQVIECMDEYHLSQEDLDTIVKLGVNQNKDKAVLKKISMVTKTAFTKKVMDLGKVPKKLTGACAWSRRGLWCMLSPFSFHFETTTEMVL